MKKIFVFAFFLLSVNANAQTLIGPNTKLRVDHNTANITDAGINRFELKIDALPFSSVGLPAPVVDTSTPPGDSTYEFSIPTTLTVGLHTFQIRVCNALECGPVSNTITIRKAASPGTPVLRITQGIAIAGVIQRGPYQLGNIAVIDVRIPDYNVVLNFGSPTWNIPGVYSAAVNDKVFFTLSK